MKRLILILLLCSSALYSQWQLRNNGLPTGSNLGWSIDAIDQNNAVAGFRTGVFITNDAGLNWRQVYTGTIVDISMVSSSIIYAITDSTILKTTNGGTTWETVFQHVAARGMLNYIKVFQNTIIAMADCEIGDTTSPAKFYKSTDEGTTWNQVNQNYLLGCWSGNLWRRMDFGSSQVGLFFESGIIPQCTFRTTDGGVTWTDVGLNAFLEVIKMYDQSFGIAIGNTQTAYSVFVTNDGGINWQSYPEAVTGEGRAITIVPNKPDEVFISTSAGLFYTANRGVSWTKQNPGFTGIIEDIVFVNENCGWLGTYDGKVYWTGNKGNSMVAVEKENKLPTQYTLEQNYPNPFNPTTKIKFSLPEAGRVTIKVFDLLGREIRTLFDNDKSAGSHVIEWNGDNALGQKVSAGIYMYSIITNKFMQTKKMVLLK